MNKYKKNKRFSLDNAIENTKFDFAGNLKWFLIAPIIIVLVGIVLVSTLGFNLGIDFTGGSNVTIMLDKDGSYVVQDYDGDLLSINDLDRIEGRVNEVLKEYQLTTSTIQKTKIGENTTAKQLGIVGKDAVIVKYQNNNTLETEEIEKINDEIKLKLLKAFGYVGQDTTLETLEDLDAKGYVENGGVTTATASAELMMKSFIALLVAIVLILIYVAFRFEVTSGLAAILALFHDVLVTASIMLICRVQINVAFIAALITILGYSINNTIIIFDRMRDELKVAKTANIKVDNNALANRSVRDTMMRSILTMATTFVMIFFITVIGVPDIREFAFPIMIGILAGFYSSVFITPGLWAIAYRPRKRKNKPQNTAGTQSADVVVEQ